MNPQQISESDLAEFLSIVAIAMQNAAPQIAEAHWTMLLLGVLGSAFLVFLCLYLMFRLADVPIGPYKKDRERVK